MIEVPPHRQSRRDRLPHHPHRAAAGHPHGRGLFRCRRRCAACARGRRGGAASARRRRARAISRSEQIIAAAQQTRRRGDPSRLRLPVGECRTSPKRCIDAGLIWVGPPPVGDPRHGAEGRGQDADGGGRRAGDAGLSWARTRTPARLAARSRRDRLSGADQGGAGGGGKGMRKVERRRRTSPRRWPPASARRRPPSATTAC